MSASLIVSHLNATLTASMGTTMHPTQARTAPPQTQAVLPPSKGSPFPEKCRHVTVGSGLPKARHMRVTLLPSFTVMSDEMLTIWGGTARHKGHQRHHQHTSLPGAGGRPQPRDLPHCVTLVPTPLPCPVSNSIPPNQYLGLEPSIYLGFGGVHSLCQPPHSMAETPITSSRYGL